MKKCVSLLFVIITVFSLYAVRAMIPKNINYQGFLTDSSGQPLTATVQMTAKIYDSETLGIVVWNELHPSVQVFQGVFSICLGEVNPIDLDFDTSYYFELIVNSETLSPRQPLSSVAYAYNAQDVLNSEIHPQNISISGIGEVIDSFGQWVGDPTGLIGATGPKGDTGIQGEPGTIGSEGPQGATGIQGLQGERGATGLQGLAGATGSQGLQGATGAEGLAGATGIQGLQGERGDTGLQGLAGATGSQGLQGATGADGLAGATGIQGLQGERGDTGLQGLIGATGVQGVTGPAGPIAGSNKQFIYNNNGSAGGAEVYYDSGKVGIGTSAPGALLEISGYMGGEGTPLILHNSHGVPAAYVGVSFETAAETLYPKTEWARIRAKSDDPWWNVNSGRLEFQVRSGGSVASKLVINSAGNVGIGTVNPVKKLEVVGSIGSDDIVVKNPWVDVRAFGAVGDGATDDTSALQSAVNYAKTVKGTVFIPVGTYRVTSTIAVTAGEFFGCRIEGANTEGAKIRSEVTGTAAIFSFIGGSGAFSNVGISNLSIEAVTAGNGAAVYINGQDNSTFSNMHISNCKYGIWLHNQSSGAFSEANQFNQMVINFCDNAIRMEQGGGDPSFHGNDFNNCFINVGANQIGLNHVSGYYYNGRFRLFMWSHDTTSTYIAANGNAEHLIGDLTYESFQPGRLSGTGRFWFQGFIRGIGGLNDVSVCGTSWQKTFACDNYWTGVTYGSTSMTAGAISNANTTYNGPNGYFQSLTKSNVTSVLLNTYNGSDENGLYLGRTGYQQGESSGVLGLFLASSGSRITSYNGNGLTLSTTTGNASLNVKNGVTVSTTSNDTPLSVSNNGAVIVNRSGAVPILGGDSNFRYQTALAFSNYFVGTLILTSGNMTNPWAPTTMYDVYYQRNKLSDITLVKQVGGWNGSWTEYLTADITGDSLRLGSNVASGVTIYWHFIGVSY